jgi:hypothetical protein
MPAPEGRAMSDKTILTILTVVTVVAVFCGAFLFGYCKSLAFERATGKKVPALDAILLDLRVEAPPR